MKCENFRRESDEQVCSVCHRRWAVDEEAPECSPPQSHSSQIHRKDIPQRQYYKPSQKEKKALPTPWELYMKDLKSHQGGSN
jgi:hypothetical protein